jgi:hypothetical protein
VAGAVVNGSQADGEKVRALARSALECGSLLPLSAGRAGGAKPRLRRASSRGEKAAARRGGPHSKAGESKEEFFKIERTNRECY